MTDWKQFNTNTPGSRQFSHVVRLATSVPLHLEAGTGGGAGSGQVSPPWARDFGSRFLQQMPFSRRYNGHHFNSNKHYTIHGKKENILKITCSTQSFIEYERNEEMSGVNVQARTWSEYPFSFHLRSHTPCRLRDYSPWDYSCSFPISIRATETRETTFFTILAGRPFGSAANDS